jgi:alkanesulfonate monooxygenase SsuD/methylene tetrahydromethanopterin reductase-like flavin-dependent oxidoreductase (luciferase family)
MEIGIGLDQSLRLTFAEQRRLVHEAAESGYTSAWTNASGVGRDIFQICDQWWRASADAVDGGIVTGVSVLPVLYWSVPALAAAAATTAEITGGRFILGLGGTLTNAAVRRRFNLADVPPVAAMREYLLGLRELLAGDAVERSGKLIELHGAQLAFRPPAVPLYVGALGPQMLRLAGELSDGAALNWCTPEQIAWSRERVTEGARRAGRDPAAVQMAEYIRICVDDDEDTARRALTRAILGYALREPGAPKDRGYRAHFGRMGFDAELSELEERRDAGASADVIVESFPRELLQMVGYFGPAAGAAAAFCRLAAGLDTAIVRVVPSRPGVAAVEAVMRACRPELVAAVGNGQ